MAEGQDFKAIQRAFTAHLRNPDANPPPGDVEDRRMDIYRSLFHSNIKGFIDSGFPVLRKLYDDAAWQAMIRDFFARHRCRTALFTAIGEEFLQYLAGEREPRPEDPPFLYELAHYEWVELALALAEEDPHAVPADPEGDLLAGIPVPSPTAWLLSYSYPVHQIAPGFEPEAPGEQPTYLLVYRDLDDAIGFTELNPVTARLWQLVEADGGVSGQSLLEQIAAELEHPRPEAVLQGGQQMLERLRRRQAILGARAA